MSNRIKHGKNDLHVSMEVMLVKEGDFWVALAPALRISGYGKTQAEAKKSFAVEAAPALVSILRSGPRVRLLGERCTPVVLALLGAPAAAAGAAAPSVLAGCLRLSAAIAAPLDRG